MDRNISALVLSTVLALAAVPFTGQDLSGQGLQAGVEARAGVAIPTGDFADAASLGIGLEGTVLLAFTPMFSAYAGYAWNRFGCDDEFCGGGEDVDFTDSGFNLGVRGSFITGGPFEPWVRAGIVFHSIELSASDDNVSASIESDRGTGFEIGGGFRYGTAGGISITPGIRYTTYEADMEVPGFGSGEVEVTHLVLDLGVGFTF